MENKVLSGNATEVLQSLEPECIDLCFTSPSPPFYAQAGIGSEKDEEEYITNLLELFNQVHRVLKPLGALYLQMSDYHIAGELPCIPERLLLLLRQDWIIRSKLIWQRTEKFEYQEDYARYARDWEYLYFLSKSKDHYFNNPTSRVLSSVLKHPYQAPQHFESGFPEKMIQEAIFRSCPPNGVVLDPLSGTGTVGVVAKRMGCQFIMIEQNEDLVMAQKARLKV